MQNQLRQMTIAAQPGANGISAFRLTFAKPLWTLMGVAAFTMGTLQLFQVVFAPRDNNDIPLTRAHLYQG